MMKNLFLALLVSVAMPAWAQVLECKSILATDLTPRQLTTIEYYDQNSRDYSDKVHRMDLTEDWNYFQALIPFGSRILDAGSGSGRDTLYFDKAGYQVEAIDASAGQAQQAFINTGIPVRVLAFEQMDYDRRFKGIWAMASLIHIDMVNFTQVLQKVINALQIDGILYATFIYGQKDFVGNDGRYFNAFTEESFAQVAQTLPNIKIIKSSVKEVTWSNGQKSKSLAVTVRRVD